MNLSIIIPVLNERETLPNTLAALSAQDRIYEVIVVDGGSADGTRQWLAQQPGIRVADSAGGKGIQLNAGARAASGDTFLFLHADCWLPRDARERVERALEKDSAVGGCFYAAFDSDRPRSLGVVAAGINFRSRITKTATGEQAIFIRRSIFEKIGGFPDWPLFEDVELVRRMKRLGSFAVIPSPVTVSARRHLACGVFRTVLLGFALRLAWWAGVPAKSLKKWFADVRPGLKPQDSKSLAQRSDWE